MGRLYTDNLTGRHRNSKYIHSHQTDKKWRETRVGRSVFVWRWAFFRSRVLVQLPVLVQREIFLGKIATRRFSFDQLADGNFFNRIDPFNLESRYCGRFFTKPLNKGTIRHLWWHLHPERAIMKSTDTSRMIRNFHGKQSAINLRIYNLLKGELNGGLSIKRQLQAIFIEFKSGTGAGDCGPSRL
ncbi:hypothetical protein [Planococcus alpniumensis]|uniref:hypothetical protein n=1 Tax=Planococcus alpniumensis TaxID=2708345 RepID=UPI001B8CE800|nr:hypothetical protein [Planococcus sp. MSAK28401]